MAHPRNSLLCDARALSALTFLVAGVCCWRPAFAQDATTVQQGTTFAKSIAPTSASQVVNPTGVSSTAWGGNTSSPTAVVPGLGAFSTPNTSSTPFSSATSMGLSGYGNQAVLNCSTFVAGPGTDPLQVQSCAAVNFMTNRCLSPSTAQMAIITSNGGSQAVSGNCEGTYGQSQAAFGYTEQLTPSDSVFTVMTGLPAAVPQETSQTCSVQTVTLTPPTYEQVNCVKNNVTTSYTCDQAMTATVTTQTVPPTLAACDNGAPTKNGTIPGGYTGPYCEYDYGPYQSDNYETIDCSSAFSFPDMTYLAEDVFFQCPEGGCIATTYCYYAPPKKCPNGYTLEGTQCAIKTVQKSFGDNCGPYTSSAGITLPNP